MDKIMERWNRVVYLNFPQTIEGAHVFPLAALIFRDPEFHQGTEAFAEFPFSQGWFDAFLQRHSISLRFLIKKAQSVPKGYKKRVFFWLQFNRRNTYLRPPFCVFSSYKCSANKRAESRVKSEIVRSPQRLPFRWLTLQIHSFTLMVRTPQKPQRRKRYEMRPLTWKISFLCIQP